MRSCASARSTDSQLHEPSDEQYASVSPLLTAGVREVLTAEGSVASRDGAAAPHRCASPSNAQS